MTTRCAVCHGLLPNQSEHLACEACAYRLRSMLVEVPKHVPLLAALLEPGSSGPPSRGSVGRAHSPMPVRLDVMDLLGPGHAIALPDPHGDQTGGVPILPLLHGWARYIADQHPAVTRDRHGTVHIGPCDAPHSSHGTDVTAWSRWLIAYLPYALTQPWIGDMYRQMEDLVWRLRGKTDRRPRKVARSAPCPSCDAFALVSVEGEPHITCEACAASLTSAEYRAHSQAVLPALTALAVRLAAA